MNFFKFLKSFKKKTYVNNTQIQNYADNKQFKGINIRNIIKHNNIPRKCYYINVGDLPSYIEYSVKSFKEQNDNFSVELLNFTYDDFFKHKYTYKILEELNFTHLEKLSKEQLISVINSFKYKLLYDYGGIVLDNSTYTLCNIDKYLSNDSFVYSSINSDFKIHKNYCFMGAVKQYKGTWDTVYPPMDYNMYNYETLKIAFYNNKLYKDVFVFNNKNLNCPIWDFSYNS